MTIKLEAIRTSPKSSWYEIPAIGIKICGKKNVEALEAYINSVAIPSVDVPASLDETSLYLHARCGLPPYNDEYAACGIPVVELSLEGENPSDEFFPEVKVIDVETDKVLEVITPEADIALEDLVCEANDENLVPDAEEVIAEQSASIEEEEKHEVFSEEELDSLHDDLVSYGFPYWDGCYTYEMGVGDVEFIKARYNEESSSWCFWYADKWGSSLEEFNPTKEELCSDGKLNDSYMEMLFSNV